MLLQIKKVANKKCCCKYKKLLQIKKDVAAMLLEPRSHFKSRLSLIVWVNVVLNRTVVVR